MTRRNLLRKGIALAVLAFLPPFSRILVDAQTQPTAVPLVIPTLTATVERAQPTAFPTRTPSASAPTQARIEAKSKDTGANLRAAPSVSSEKLGTIFPGTFYAVIGRSDKWLQIKYDQTPAGVAWVFEDIVNITGLDPAQIPTIAQNAVPSPNVSTAAAQATANFITLTPGAPQTATVLQASATGVFTLAAGGAQAKPTEILPTFTFPPPVIEATLRPSGVAATSQGGLPPIIPIIALGGVGLVGLFVSALRRL